MGSQGRKREETRDPQLEDVVVGDEVVVEEVVVRLADGLQQPRALLRQQRAAIHAQRQLVHLLLCARDGQAVSAECCIAFTVRT